MECSTYKDFTATTPDDEGGVSGHHLPDDDNSLAEPQHLTYRDLRHIWCMGIDNGLIGQLHKQEWGLLVGRNPGTVAAFNRVCCLTVTERNLRTTIETFRDLGANPPLARPIRRKKVVSRSSWVEASRLTPMTPRDYAEVGAGLGGTAPRGFCSMGAAVTKVMVNGRLRPSKAA
jgi:hypothetical protein